MRKAIVFAVLLGLAVASALMAGVTTYQPVGSHVIYGDGSTDFYYAFTSPSGQYTTVTVFFGCYDQKAVVTTSNGGAALEVPITMTCLTPPNLGPVSVTSGGSGEVGGMTITINPSSWTIAKGSGYRAPEYVVNSSINVPLGVQ